MKEKGNGKLARFVVFLGLIILAVVFIYSFFIYKNTTVYFNPAKKSAAERLYEGVMDHDLDNEYPKTAEEVMQINLDIMRLFYGDMIVEDEIYDILITQMRKLFSEELLVNNSFESQRSVILEGVALIDEFDLYCVDIVQLPVIYDPYDDNKCYIRVEEAFNDATRLYWEYELKRESKQDPWYISRWAMTDETYTEIKPA